MPLNKYICDCVVCITNCRKLNYDQVLLEDIQITLESKNWIIKNLIDGAILAKPAGLKVFELRRKNATNKRTVQCYILQFAMQEFMLFAPGLRSCQF